ncbi:response regulator [Fuchsiella alkaliacetigena]|uniref:response regulator n=1 Tax=Fuchsiella alkaliacetigena TaxID=957042 RepID=UPI00200A03C8|nr:response regulator [Fuchsiella alkaliacetigena]MCK8824050.1 response regulator [Fuchsiella alkaliacetigena]
MKLNFKSVKAKLVLVSIILIFVVLGVLNTFIIPTISRNIYDEKKTQVQEMVNAALGVMDYYYELESKGELSRVEAQRRAREVIAGLTYGPDNQDYFWIQDTKPEMIVHPFRPDLDGEYIGDFEDPEGIRLFTEMAEIVENEGSGFVEYQWQYYDVEDRIEPKISYVEHFEEWGWILGTGVYVNDVKDEVFSVIETIILITVLLFVGVGFVVSILANTFTGPIIKADKFAQEITAGNLEVEDLQVKGKDEISSLIKSLNKMKNRLKADLRERKEKEEELVAAKEEAEVANRAKSQFLANMSHEIRTPINAIIGLSHIAKSKSENPELQKYISKIQRSSDDLLKIINDILDYSKIEAGSLELEETNFYIHEVINNVVEMFTYQAQEKGLELKAALDPQVPAYVEGDPLRLKQVLINLTSNAIKFTESGEVTLIVNVVAIKEKEVEIIFSVKDTGIGIAPEEQQDLFQEFSQADSSTSREYGGTGLGLSISKRLVELMDGQIWVESELNKGSTFSFSLCFAIQEDITAVEFLLDREGLKVLIVDDDPSSQEVLKELMTSFNYDYRVVSCGEEAIEELELGNKQRKTEPYDLVLLDYKLPKVDGLEVAQWIKKRLELKKRPAIIMVTAYENDAVKEKAESLGLEGFLVKPVNQSVLFNVIIKVFGQQEHLFSLTDQQGQISELQEQSLAGFSVLLVEDNLINQEIAKELMEDVGLQVSVVENGEEAVEKVKEEDFDLILMDVQMPVMDGYEATKIIRADSKNQDIPIIAITAHAMLEDKEHCLEVGMNDYISKPFMPQEFLLKLSKWINDGISFESKVREVDIVDNLSNLDVEAGLKRVNDNRNLYFKLLNRFLEMNKESLAKIKKASLEGDQQLIKEEAHSLKGTAANIGANQVAKLCQQIQEGKFSEQAIEELEAELALVESYITDLLEDYNEQEEVGEISKGDAKRFYQLLADLENKLEDNSFVREEFLASIATELPEQEEVIEQFELLKESLDNFDYQAALSILSKLKDLSS